MAIGKYPASYAATSSDGESILVDSATAGAGCQDRAGGATAGIRLDSMAPADRATLADAGAGVGPHTENQMNVGIVHAPSEPKRFNRGAR
jgi:hypothetical protein